MPTRFELASKRDDVSWRTGNAKGAESPTYAGGKYIDDKGYVKLLRPDHPKNIRGYIYEHRGVMERYLGRMLLPWETVHHINEVKTDNRIENLFLCTVKEHSAIHREGKRPTDAHREKMREVAKRTKPHLVKKSAKKKNSSVIQQNKGREKPVRRLERP
jgi:hypothetical protein